MLFVGVVLLGVAIVSWSTVTLLAGSASGAQDRDAVKRTVSPENDVRESACQNVIPAAA
jgi:hypothetical protein